MDEKKKLERVIIKALKTVYDPELPVNIYDLGLIYAIDIADDNSVNIKMTLTSPNCPVADSLPFEVKMKTGSIEEVTSVKVELVWDPPFSKEMMSEEAKFLLGMF